MASFDAKLRALIEEWLRRGASPESLVEDMQREINDFSNPPNQD